MIKFGQTIDVDLSDIEWISTGGKVSRKWVSIHPNYPTMDELVNARVYREIGHEEYVDGKELQVTTSGLRVVINAYGQNIRNEDYINWRQEREDQEIVGVDNGILTLGDTFKANAKYISTLVITKLKNKEKMYLKLEKESDNFPSLFTNWNDEKKVFKVIRTFSNGTVLYRNVTN